MRLITSPTATRQLLVAMAMAGSIAACSSTTAAPAKSPEAAGKAAEVSTPAAEAPLPPRQEIAMGCLEANAGWALGKQVDDALMAKAKADATAQYVRVIKPGVAVTMEYNGARLNLHTNIKGQIERVTCG